MRSIELDFDVQASPDLVFDELTDLTRLDRWRTLESIRLEPEGPAAVGTRLYSEVKGPGQPMRFVNEITVLDRAAGLYDDRWLEGTFLIESGWRVQGAAGGARIHWTTRYEGRGRFKLLGPLLGNVIRRGQRDDLKRFAKMING